MKLIHDSASKIVEEQILEHVHKVCLDQLSVDEASLDDNILIQGLIAVSVNASDVLVIHINNKLHCKGAEASNTEVKRLPEPDIVDLSDDNECGTEGLITNSNGTNRAEEFLAAGECKEKHDSLDDSTLFFGDDQLDSLEQNGLETIKESTNDLDQTTQSNQDFARKEITKQPGLSNDADISIVRHHQRRKRTYANSAMSIKREPQDMSNRYRKLDLSPTNYFAPEDIEHFDNLISPDKNVLDMSFNDELVADLGCIDLDDTLGGISSQSSDRGQHLSQYTCGRCGYSCTNAEDLDKHQLLHIQLSVASVTGDIDIDLTEDCTDEDQSVAPATTPSSSTPSSVISEHHIPDEYDRLSLSTNGCTSIENTLSGVAGALSNDDLKLFAGKLLETDKLQTHSANTNNGETDSKHSKKAKNTECPTCGKVFQRTQHLNEHSLTHTREKPHNCPHCRKCYRLKSHLKRHIQQCH